MLGATVAVTAASGAMWEAHDNIPRHISSKVQKIKKWRAKHPLRFPNGAPEDLHHVPKKPNADDQKPWHAFKVTRPPYYYEMVVVIFFALMMGRWSAPKLLQLAIVTQIPSATVQPLAEHHASSGATFEGTRLRGPSGGWRLGNQDWQYVTLAELFFFGAKEVTAFHLYKMYLNLDHYIHNKQRQRGSGGRKGR
jgi:hypothetical protein